MAKNVIGIDISDFSIEAVVLNKSRGHFNLKAYSRFRLSPEIVEDGRILNPDKLKDAIQKMLKNAQPHSLEDYKKVFLSIPESQVYSKVFSLPKKLKDKALAKAIKNKAEEIFPEMPDRLVSAMKVLKSNGDSKDVFYAAAELESIYEFVKVFDSLGMDVIGITSESISSFAGLDQKQEKKNTLLLDIGARITIASIFDPSGIIASININIAGDNLTKALAEKMNISYSAAEEKKRQIGMTSEGDGETMLVIQGQLQPLNDELKRFINHFEQSSGQKLEQVLLIGGLAQMKGIDQYFGENLSLEIQVGQPFLDSNEFVRGDVTKYINALGLAKLGHAKSEIDFYRNLSKENLAEQTKDQSEKKSTEKVKKSDSNKPSKKINKLSFKKLLPILIVLLIIIIGGALYFFKDDLSKCFSRSSDNNVPVETGQEELDDVSTFELPATVSITVGSKPHGGDNFVLGEYHEIVVEYKITDTQGGYIDSLDSLEIDSSKSILAELNNTYSKENYYIIPQVLQTEVVESSPLEPDFVAGDVISASIKYKLLALNNNLLNNLLADISLVLAENIVVSNYRIFSYTVDNESDLFELRVTFDKQ